MHLRLFTLRYSPTLGALDDRPLRAFLERVELLAVREHFFLAEDIPHLAVLVFWRTPEDSLPQASGHAKSRASNGPAEPSLKLDDLSEAQRALFERLRAWRRERAETEGVPPFVVFSNRQLAEIVRRSPDSANALGAIDGIGPAKLERYGRQVLAIVRPEEVES